MFLDEELKQREEQVLDLEARLSESETLRIQLQADAVIYSTNLDHREPKHLDSFQLSSFRPACSIHFRPRGQAHTTIFLLLQCDAGIEDRGTDRDQCATVRAPKRETEDPVFAQGSAWDLTARDLTGLGAFVDASCFTADLRLA